MRELLSLSLVTLVAVAFGACQDEVVSPDSPTADASRGRGGGPPGNGPAVPAAGCDVTVPDEQPTIQDGVDAAGSGDEVCVEASGGPYREQVVVNEDLILKGLGGPVLDAPADPADFTIPESANSTWEPVIFAFGGTETGGAVGGAGTVDVNLRGFTIDGGGRSGGGPRYPAVLYRNANGTVADNTVRNMGVGGRETFGILAYGDSDVSIRDNTVSGYERGGVGANGDGGAHPAPSVEIVGNRLTGSGDGTRTGWAPNGIQLGFGATGRVMDNDVERSRWAAKEGDSWAASCILVFESDGVKIRGNEVSNCDVGIGVGSWAWFRSSADNTKIVRNTVDGALMGLELEAIAWDRVSGTDPSVSNTKLTGNELSGVLPGGAPGDFGVFFEVVDADPDFDPVADNNKVINNRITGFDVPIDTGSSTDTKRAANKPFSP